MTIRRISYIFKYMLLEINIENIFKEIKEYTNELYSSKLVWVGLGWIGEFIFIWNICIYELSLWPWVALGWVGKFIFIWNICIYELSFRAWVGLGREIHFNMEYIYIYFILKWISRPDPTQPMLIMAGHIHIFHMKMNFSIRRNVGLN